MQTSGCNLLKEKVALDGVEPPTHGLGNRCSIHLSYRAIPIAKADSGLRNPE